MLVYLNDLIKNAKKNKYGLGSFNVFNIETLEGVISAANNMRSPIIVAVGEVHFEFSNIENFVNIVKTIANQNDIPIVLHLDHATKKSSIINAIKYGFTSLMFDGPPNINFEDKVNLTEDVVKIAHSFGILIESMFYDIGFADEKGHIIKKETYSDLDKIASFIDKTGIDTLAVNIGSTHNLPRQEAKIDFELLKKIKEKVDCYLSLHGGSSVTDKDLKESIKKGINKVSIYTFNSLKAIGRMEKYLIDKKNFRNEAGFLPKVFNEVRQSFKVGVESKLKLLGCENIRS